MGDLGSLLGLDRSSGEGKGYPLHYSWPREFYGLCSSWGFKELDITEQLSLFICKRQPRFMKVFCGGGSSIAPNPSVDDGSTSFCSVPLQFCIARHAGRMGEKTVTESKRT